WAAPTTLVGLVAGLLTLCTGGRVQRRCGALEFHGGFSRWLGRRCGFSAMTLGPVIIGLDPPGPAFCPGHGEAHVRPVERWGGRVGVPPRPPGRPAPGRGGGAATTTATPVSSATPAAPAARASDT